MEYMWYHGGCCCSSKAGIIATYLYLPAGIIPTYPTVFSGSIAAA